MVGKAKKGKGRLDKFYHMAKEQGYRSRAAFKLIQLNRKYNFLSNCRSLMDLCAAPGGWLQVAVKNMPLSSLIIGVDLAPIKPIRGVKTLLQDITTQACRQALRKEAGGNLFDAVLHDGAPNIGGAWSNEAYTQAALVLDSLRLATEFLAPGGTFVTKVFRSKDYNALLYAFNQLFNKVEATKPTASRNTSAEIFVVCLGYKAPAKIDPRLLDPRHLFQEVTEVKKVMGPDALMKQKIKQRRHREGYEEGLSTSYKATSALAFLVSDAPVELLGRVTQIALEGAGSWAPIEEKSEGDDDEAEGVSKLANADLKELADAVRRHPATDAEVRALCGDLQVLGRTEFKALLKWRTTLRKALREQLGVSEDKGKKDASKKGDKGAAGKAEGAEGAEAGAEGEGEDDVMADMARAKEAMERKARKEKKKAREMKRKARIRTAQLASGEGMLDVGGPEELFSLGRAVKGGEKALSKVVEMSAPGEADLELLEAPDSSDEEVELGGAGSDSDLDSDLDSDDHERLRYEMDMEDALDNSYKQYLERKGHREDLVREKRKRLGMTGDLLGSDDEEGGAPGAADAAEGSDGEEGSEEESEEEGLTDGDEEEEEGGRGAKKARRGRGGEEDKLGGGLLVTLDESRAGVAKSGAAMAAQWFGQELFDDPNLEADDEDEGEEEEEDEEEDEEEEEAGSTGAGKAGKGGKAAKAAEDDATRFDSDSDDEEGRAKKSKKGGAGSAAAVMASVNGGKRGRDAGGYEVVPVEKGKKGKGGKGAEDKDVSGSDTETDSEDEYDLLDDQGKAEVLALAKRMLRRKDKESIIDAAYNRYAFHDAGMPRWFVEDERRHMCPIMPVTKEEVEEEKARLRAVDARPIKKVAEAKARQRKRVITRLSSAREKAEAIAAQEDVPLNSKMREIERLYARARAGGKKGKGKGKDGKGKDGKGKGGGKRVALDKRMLKDRRAQKRIDKKGGGRKGGKGGAPGGAKGGVKKGGAAGGRSKGGKMKGVAGGARKNPNWQG